MKTSFVSLTRIHHPDGTFSAVITLRAPAERLTFAAMDQRDRTIKLAEIAHLRAVKAQARGVEEPRIVVLARLEQDQAVSRLFPGLDPHTEEGERLYSANSLLTYTLRTLLSRGWLRYDGADWRAAVPAHEPLWRERARAVLTFLTRQDRLYLGGKRGRRRTTATDFAGFDARRDLVPVDRLGFLREFVWRERPLIAFNAAFFLLEHDDWGSHHSALGEAYNLYIYRGVVLRPALYRRAAFFRDGSGRWRAERLSLADMRLILPQGTTLTPTGAPETRIGYRGAEGRAAAVAYTRASGLAERGAPLHRTPTEPGRIEYTIVDRRIVSRKTGGGLEIPQNGLVLSFAPGDLPAGTIPNAGLAHLSFRFVGLERHRLQQAIQAGPLLLQDGQIVVSDDALRAETFWPTPPGVTAAEGAGIVPTDYPLDADRTRAGRIGLGVDAEGRLVVVAVPGTERGAHRPEADSAGATLRELAERLAEAGAVAAINLDGGGSTQLFYRGGLLTPPGNRYRLPGVQFERMVPSVGVVDW